jgi:CHAT domain-containing protein
MRREEIKGLLVHESSPLRGWKSIYKVKDEARRVRETFQAAGVALTTLNDSSPDGHPSASDVLTSLRNNGTHFLHLACHGAQKADPLSSAFIFRDQDLSIQELVGLDLGNAMLAFLSACETAKGDQDQPDQAIHLAASMLFCGFKSVIGTMKYVAC